MAGPLCRRLQGACPVCGLFVFHRERKDAPDGEQNQRKGEEKA